MHHVRPYALGGKTERKNLRPVCGACHKKINELSAFYTYIDFEIGMKILEQARIWAFTMYMLPPDDTFIS